MLWFVPPSNPHDTVQLFGGLIEALEHLWQQELSQVCMSISAGPDSKEGPPSTAAWVPAADMCSRKVHLAAALIS